MLLGHVGTSLGSFSLDPKPPSKCLAPPRHALPPILYIPTVPQLKLCLLLLKTQLKLFLLQEAFLNPTSHTYCCSSTDSSIVCLSPALGQELPEGKNWVSSSARHGEGWPAHSLLHSFLQSTCWNPIQN